MKFKTKKKTKILIGVLSGVLILGGVGAVSGWVGYAHGQTINDQINLFINVKIENKEIEYDGEVHSLDIKLPENATETHIIKNNEGLAVTECKEVGDYTFYYTVQIGEATRDFKATLKIKKLVEVSTPLAAKMLKVSDTEYKITASLTPSTYESFGVSWEIAWANPTSTWANGKSVGDYVTLTDNNDLSCNLKKTVDFGEQIVVTCFANIDTSLTAKCTLDFEKKVTSVVAKINSSSVDGTVLTDGSKAALGSDVTYSSVFSKDKTYSTSYSLSLYEGGCISTKVNGKTASVYPAFSSVNYTSLLNLIKAATFSQSSFKSLYSSLSSYGTMQYYVVTGYTNGSPTYTSVTKNLTISEFETYMSQAIWKVTATTGSMIDTINFSINVPVASTISVSDSSVVF